MRPMHLFTGVILATIASVGGAQNRIETIELPPSLPASIPDPAPVPVPDIDASVPGAEIAIPAETEQDAGPPSIADPVTAAIVAEAAERARGAALNAEMARSATEQRQAAADARTAAEAAAQADYQAALDAHEREAARIDQEHRAAMQEWRARADACMAGDKTACAPR